MEGKDIMNYDEAVKWLENKGINCDPCSEPWYEAEVACDELDKYDEYTEATLNKILTTVNDKVAEWNADEDDFDDDFDNSSSWGVENESLNESKYSSEARDIMRFVADDIKKYDWAKEEDYYYMIGSELAARDLPFIPYYFLDDEENETGKHYQDIKAGYLDNGGTIADDIDEAWEDDVDTTLNSDNVRRGNISATKTPISGTTYFRGRISPEESKAAYKHNRELMKSRGLDPDKVLPKAEYTEAVSDKVKVTPKFEQEKAEFEKYLSNNQFTETLRRRLARRHR